MGKLSFAPVERTLPTAPVIAKTAEQVGEQLAEWLRGVLDAPDQPAACIMVNRQATALRQSAARTMDHIGGGAYGPEMLAAFSGTDGRVARARILIVPVKEVGAKTGGGYSYVYHVSAEKFDALADYAKPRA